MAVSPCTFRRDLPAFADPCVYPDATIVMWLALAKIMLHVDRWGGPGACPPTSPPSTLIDYGYELFAAHYITLNTQAVQSSQAGGVADAQSGPVASESVGPLSTSYDVNVAVDVDDGQWNLTVWGKMFVQLAKMAGMGGIVLGGTPGHGFGFGAGGGGFAANVPFAGPTDYLLPGFVD